MDTNNHPYPTYPDSNNSTPRSREIDFETNSYDDYNYKVKLMCSYGGKILPRPHDNQLSYVGGDTKILTVDRNIRFASISHKLHSLTDRSDVCFKYQLPGEDLDALVSVTNDEDLEHMMTEYDRIYRSSVKPVRLRLFMFPLSGFGGGGESKTDQQWFVDALNAVQISQSGAGSQAVESADFLLGIDKVEMHAHAHASNAREVVHPEFECGLENNNSNIISNSNSNRHIVSDPVVSTTTVEIQRQMHEYHRMPDVGTHEQTINKHTINIDPQGAYYGDYYTPKIQPAAATSQPWYMATGGYPMSVAGTESPIYLMPSSTGVYPASVAGQTLRPTAQVSQGQAYYGMQRMPEYYREQQIHHPKVGAYQEAIGMVSRPQAQAEMGYGQVYYATAQGGMNQPVVAMQGIGLAVNQEGKMVMNQNKVP